MKNNNRPKNPFTIIQFDIELQEYFYEEVVEGKLKMIWLGSNYNFKNK